MYLVIEPARINNVVKPVPTMMFDDVEQAKAAAKRSRSRFEAKGWASYADKVKIRNPRDPDVIIELAKQMAEYKDERDWNSGGNDFYVQTLCQHINTMRIRADQIANPESYAD